MKLKFEKPVREEKEPKRLRRSKPIERSSKRIARTKRPRKERKTTLAALKRKLWALFAAYVKERDGNQCFTCPARPEGRAWHAGHMIRSTKATTRYDPANVHSQCAYCNKWLHGNEGEYTVRFIARYGLPKLRALYAQKEQIKNWKAHEIAELVDALEKGGHFYEALYAEKYGLIHVQLDPVGQATVQTTEAEKEEEKA